MHALGARIEALDVRDWRRLAAAATLAALAVRAAVLILDHGRGGADLQLYRFYGDLVLHGHNAYLLAPHAPFALFTADNQPLELGLFAGLLGIHDSPDSLRVGFAVIDALLVPLVLLGWTTRSRGWRVAVAGYLAFNPFTLLAWTGFCEDKPVVLGLTILILIAVERGRPGRMWAAATVLAAFKWLSVFFALPMLIDSWRRVPHRRLVAILALCAAVLALSEVPSFPEDLEAYTRRGDRIDLNPPIHASITMLLSRVGLYSPAIVRPFIVVSLLVLVALFATRRLALPETIVLSALCSSVLLPNQAVNRVLMIAVPLLFVVGLSRRRWIAIWALSVAGAVALYVNTRGPEALTPLFGHYGDVRHVLWMNALMVVLLGFLAADKLREHRGGRYAPLSTTSSETTSRRSRLAS